MGDAGHHETLADLRDKRIVLAEDEHALIAMASENVFQQRELGGRVQRQRARFPPGEHRLPGFGVAGAGPENLALEVGRRGDNQTAAADETAIRLPCGIVAGALVRRKDDSDALDLEASEIAVSGERFGVTTVDLWAN